MKRPAELTTAEKHTMIDFYRKANLKAEFVAAGKQLSLPVPNLRPRWQVSRRVFLKKGWESVLRSFLPVRQPRRRWPLSEARRRGRFPNELGGRRDDASKGRESVGERGGRDAASGGVRVGGFERGVF